VFEEPERSAQISHAKFARVIIAAQRYKEGLGRTVYRDYTVEERFRTHTPLTKLELSKRRGFHVNPCLSFFSLQ